MDCFKSRNIACRPLSTLNDLLSWSPGKDLTSRQYKIEPFKREYVINQEPNEGKFIVCHDMKNNYLEDRYFHGYPGSNCFSFYHWNFIDIFIYFSHHLITIPPESWINAAHENNVRILGTFITEFDRGKQICNELFENLDKSIDKLVFLTLYYKFDGWLINIENEVEDINKLKYFVSELNKRLKQIDKDLYKVIWYDSVIENGSLKWQNELNDSNYSFFQKSDGFFVNYTWKEENLKNSKEKASKRFSDVYVGIDVFGRGVLGNGGFNCNLALNKIRENSLSCALFAPGWLHECNDPNEFYKNSDLFWNLLSNNLERRKIRTLPIITNFSHSSCKNFFLNGIKMKSEWTNLNQQGLMTTLINSEGVSWDFDEGFFGGNSILLDSDSNLKLFDCSLGVSSKKCLLIEYCIKKIKNEQDNFKKNFQLCIEYTYSNQNLMIKLDNDLKKIILNSCFEIRSYSSRNFENNWIKHSFRLFVDNDLIITSISAINTNNNHQFKLGFFRIMFDSFNHQHKIPRLASNNFEVHHHTNTFKFGNEIYLLIHLDLNAYDDQSLKYFSIFINISRNSAKNFRLIGSTRSQKFFACLKLKEDDLEIDSTNHSTNECLSFDLYVQFVDKLLSCTNDTIRKDLDESDFIKKLNIKIENVKFKNSKQNNLCFIYDLIHDLEIF